MPTRLFTSCMTLGKGLISKSVFSTEMERINGRDCRAGVRLKRHLHGAAGTKLEPVLAIM